MNDNDKDKYVARTVSLTPKGRRWIELIQREGLTPDEAMRRVEAEIAAERNPQ